MNFLLVNWTEENLEPSHTLPEVTFTQGYFLFGLHLYKSQKEVLYVHLTDLCQDVSS